MKELTFNEQVRKKLKGGMQKNALDFIAFLRANEIQPPNPGVDWYDGPGGAYVCFLSVCPDWKKRISWTIWMGGYDCALCREENQDYPIDEDLKEFVWARVHTCVHFSSGGKHCGDGCQPGKSIKLFGREFHNICQSILCIRNAGGEDLEKAKRLAIVWKQSGTEEK